MKSMIKVALFSALFMLVSLSSYAQRGGGDRPSPEERAKQLTTQMAEHLDLSEDQVKKVEEINLSYAKKMMEAREAAQSDRSAMRSKMESMTEDRNKDLKEILTEEQFESLEEMRSERKPRGERRKRGKKN